MDQLDGMRLLVRVVERRSFSAAASDLGLPRSSATTGLKQLEERLGVRLLQRTTRRLTPTQVGQSFFDPLPSGADVSEEPAFHHAFQLIELGEDYRTRLVEPLASSRHLMLPRLIN